MVDRYVRENRVALEVFADRGRDEFNGIDGRSMRSHAGDWCGLSPSIPGRRASDTGVG